jgi:hypothetical protein
MLKRNVEISPSPSKLINDPKSAQIGSTGKRGIKTTFARHE